MEERPLVSILIPCYNSARFLDETLLSCKNQEYDNIEVILVDDSSTDSSLQIAMNWEQKWDKLHVFTQPNSGACHARNIAFENSKGKYIMYLDADDIISPNKISEQVKLLSEKSELTVSTCAWRHFNVNIDDLSTKQFYCYRDFDRGIDLLKALWNYGEMFQTSCYLVHRNLIYNAGKWLEGLKKNQDGEFFARLLLKADNIIFCDKAVVYYRTGDYDSVSKDNSETKVSALLYSFEEYMKNVLPVDDSLEMRTALAKNFSLFRYLYNGQYPVLSRKAKQHIHELGVKAPICGTKRVRQISGIIGFENFLLLRKLFLKK